MILSTGQFLERGSFLLLCLLAALLPFEAHQTVVRLAGLTPLKLLFLLMSVLLVAAALLLRESPPRLAPCAAAAAALCLAFWVSGMAASDFRDNALKSALRYAVGLALFLEVSFLTRKEAAARSRMLLTALWVGGLASTILGCVILAGFPWADDLARLFRPFEYYVYFTRRFSATLEYPNIAAAYLVLTVPPALLWAVARKSATRRTLALGLLVFPMLLGLVLTYSRGGTAACVLACMATAGLAWRAQCRREARYLAAAAALTCALYLPLNNWQLLSRGDSAAEGTPPISAAYELSEKRIQRQPGQTYETEIRVINNGSVPWKNTRAEPLALSFRWYEIDRRTAVRVEPLFVDLPEEVLPGEGLTLRAHYRTPLEEGHYYLIWELFQFRDRIPWFTGRRIIPGVAECFISRTPQDLDSLPWGDPFRPRNEGQAARSPAGEPSRLRLWQAALKMFREHPWLGVGGGNFRLLYGRYLGMERWDTRIQANSLVLEIAAGCGLPGLAALGLFAWSAAGCLRKKLKELQLHRRGIDGAVHLGLIAAIIGFGLHNLVDYFMEFTPTYFAFWMLLGLAASSPGRSGTGPCAAAVSGASR